MPVFEFKSEDLYTNSDPVVVLDDGSFIGTNCRIKSDVFQTKGILKAYAPWCGHCQAKVDCINRLAEILPDYGVSVYVINVEANPMFADHFKDRVRGFPTFLTVNDGGRIGDVLLNKDGEQVFTVPDIIASLCGNDSRICKLAESVKDCT